MKRQPIGRYYTRRESLVFEASDFDEDGLLKERGEEGDPITDLSFLARAERLDARAKAFLREQGYPDCRAVSFPPGRPEEWEACEGALDPRPYPAWSRIDCYLREYRGVQDDEAEDLAARIVCAAYELKQARNNDVAMLAAYKLGELAVLSHVYAEEDRQRKKRRQPRLKPKISAACINLVNGNPEITNSEAWIAFDDERVAGEDVFRDGDKLVEVDRRGRESGITRNTFNRYMTHARSRRSVD